MHKIQPHINQVIEHQIGKKKKKKVRNMAEDLTLPQDARKEQVSPTSIKNKSSRSSCNIYTIQKKKNHESGETQRRNVSPVKMPLFKTTRRGLQVSHTFQPNLLKSLARTLYLSVCARDAQFRATAGAKNAVSSLTRGSQAPESRLSSTQS